ncbi:MULTISPECIES: transglycosylase SLT domain-containing protein [Ramlibacter]|uniref:Transglycosylase SLT domain-containing protein n=1 Tax=Ramlibacter pinisoli TaxID=2682844 RepID=A0A6N8IW35_9BURK|nr:MULTISPECIES: transglycosylase SLT domain-containing protein [Ramlibacter]MBA2961236.1 transglycosylase SLT domain-containing protein [Ramlibacter sp. CGMCC 1.13660]MVQ31181.1 transglycosylase SLT domain-containing protein [Ramlibacter pinisoli]
MKFSTLAALAFAVWLAGCATAPTDTTLPPLSSEGVTSSVPATPPAAAVPAGPLKPITPADASSRGVAATQPPADLWDRIRRGYAMPNLEGDLVRQQEQWYATRPDYMQRMTDRSRKYLFHIVEELERRGMPVELALLPFIESAFNPQAVSSARAAGMWQFMPGTGRDYDLKQNLFRDDRRNVLASTRAALDYLQRLYGMFGDWHLALAAYNWGEGNVGRAIARNQRAGLGTRYVDLSMPNETRNYVPKLQAVKNIVANPDSFRAELPVIENHPYFDTVTVGRDIDIDLAARLAGIELDDFKALNPQLNRPVVLAAGTPQILLPWDNAQVFQRNMSEYNEGRFASWTAWTVPGTMSVGEAARRVGMNENELRSVNAIPPRMLIKAGSVLVVARPPSKQEDVAEHLADNGQLSLAPEVTQRRTTVKAGRNESVASIARRYKVAPAQVAEWNNVGASAAFRAGQQVVVYLPVRAAARATPRTHGPHAVAAVPRAKPAPAKTTKSSKIAKSQRR